ncbi:hypothetical protein AB4254_11815 [Vibrio breoganii]
MNSGLSGYKRAAIREGIVAALPYLTAASMWLNQKQMSLLKVSDNNPYIKGLTTKGISEQVAGYALAARGKLEVERDEETLLSLLADPEFRDAFVGEAKDSLGQVHSPWAISGMILQGVQLMTKYVVALNNDNKANEGFDFRTDATWSALREDLSASDIVRFVNSAKLFKQRTTPAGRFYDIRRAFSRTGSFGDALKSMSRSDVGTLRALVEFAKQSSSAFKGEIDRESIKLDSADISAYREFLEAHFGDEADSLNDVFEYASPSVIREFTRRGYKIDSIVNLVVSAFDDVAAKNKGSLISKFEGNEVVLKDLKDDVARLQKGQRTLTGFSNVIADYCALHSGEDLDSKGRTLSTDGLIKRLEFYEQVSVIFPEAEYGLISKLARKLKSDVAVGELRLLDELAHAAPVDSPMVATDYRKGSVVLDKLIAPQIKVNGVQINSSMTPYDVVSRVLQGALGSKLESSMMNQSGVKEYSLSKYTERVNVRREREKEYRAKKKFINRTALSLGISTYCINAAVLGTSSFSQQISSDSVTATKLFDKAVDVWIDPTTLVSGLSETFNMLGSGGLGGLLAQTAVATLVLNTLVTHYGKHLDKGYAKQFFIDNQYADIWDVLKDGIGDNWTGDYADLGAYSTKSPMLNQVKEKVISLFKSPPPAPNGFDGLETSDLCPLAIIASLYVSKNPEAKAEVLESFKSLGYGELADTFFESNAADLLESYARTKPTMRVVLSDLAKASQRFESEVGLTSGWLQTNASFTQDVLEKLDKNTSTALHVNAFIGNVEKYTGYLSIQEKKRAEFNDFNKHALNYPEGDITRRLVERERNRLSRELILIEEQLDKTRLNIEKFEAYRLNFYAEHEVGTEIQTIAQQVLEDLGASKGAATLLADEIEHPELNVSDGRVGIRDLANDLKPINKEQLFNVYFKEAFTRLNISNDLNTSRFKRASESIVSVLSSKIDSSYKHDNTSTPRQSEPQMI